MSSLAVFRTILGQERGLFVRMVEAVQDEGLDYRPDAKSRCSRELIQHFSAHVHDLTELVEDGVINHRNQIPFDSLPAAAKQLDDSFGVLLEKLDGLDEEAWARPAEFRFGEQVIMEAPREQLAWMMLLDAVHHRGQLSTHLRPTGGKVPSLYGPSADEEMPAH